MATRLKVIVEKVDDEYVIKLPQDLVEKSLRWRQGEEVVVEMAEWRGRLVLVIYKS